jgi:hypothetical protein
LEVFSAITKLLIKSNISMKKQSTFTKRIFALGAMAAVVFCTAGNSVSLAQTTETQEFLTAEAPIFTASANEDDMMAPAAAGTNANMQPAVEEKAAPATNTAPAKEAVKAGKENKIKSLPAKMLMKTAVKKLEKAQKKMDIKAEKAAKEGKQLDQQVKVGIIIAVIGLLLIIVGAAAYSGVLAGLGSLALVVGLVVILLAALEVI